MAEEEKKQPPIDPGQPGIDPPKTDYSVANYMGEQVTAPVMPAPGMYVPGIQEVQEQELLEGTPLTGTPQVTTAPAATSTVGPIAPQTAAKTTAQTIEGKTPLVDAQTGTVTALIDPATGTITNPAGIVVGNVQGQVQKTDVTQRAVSDAELTQAAVDTGASLVEGYTPAQSDYVSSITGATMEVTPDMTVQGQLARISSQFTDGKVPSWAASIVRQANAVMLNRGVAASSMAGAAITQAMLEAALPIATADASAYYNTAVKIMDNEQQALLENSRQNANISLANTSNRQQMALSKLQVQAALAGQSLTNTQQANVLKAERFAEAANANFSQENQRVFANSGLVQTLNLQNLSNEQATTLANAANFAQMDISNLNNRQQAQVQNSQNFFQLDLTNLSNQQQAEVLNQQTRTQALLSDQAALNAASNINAETQNQVNQFYDTLNSSISTNNAAQTNAQNQYNAGQLNAASQFKATMQNDRDKFEVTNAIAIEQSNTTWRKNINTANTAAINAANQINAANYLNISNQALANIWQQYRDEGDYAYSASENSRDRAFNYALAMLEAKVNKDNYDMYLNEATANGLGSFLANLGLNILDNKKETS